MSVSMIQLAAAFVFVGLASITDIRRREIPAPLVYILIAVGVGSNAVAGGLIGDIIIPLSSMAAGLMGFAVGLLFWKTGVWAGGDAKFYAGLCALLPALGFLRFPLFTFALLLTTMAAFVIYTFLHTIYHVARGVNPTMRRVKINMLQEGMVSGEYIFKDGLAVKRSPYGRGHPYPKFTEIYANPKGMEGLSKGEIEKLKSVLGEDDTLWVRRTHAFVPFFLIGLITMLVLVI